MKNRHTLSVPLARSPLRAASLALLAGAALALAVVGVRVRRDASSDPGTVVAAYCIDCHNTTDFDGGIAFAIDGSDVNVSAFAGDESPAAIWELAVRKVRAGMMPPAGAPRPGDRAVLERFVGNVEQRLDRAWALAPYPGAEPLSRLNRAEYAAAIRDLLDYDASAVVAALPVDEAVGGFDNMGDGLSVSPTLIEAYVATAMTVARAAVGDRNAGAAQVRYEAPARLAQDRHVDGLPLESRGGFVFEHNFPLDAVYELRVAATGPGAIATQTFCERPDVIVAIDGRILDAADPRRLRLSVAAGPHTVAAALIDNARCSGVNELHDVYSVGGGIRHVEIHGPFDATGPGDTPSRRAIFSCYPGAAAEEAACAREIMARLATEAYRRPIPPAAPEVETLLEFYRRGRADGDFETGIQQALARLLMSPQFVFQLEQEPADLAPGTAYQLTDLEIASRLSFFIWSSLPDRELIELASHGRLTDSQTLRAQVARMLADPRARALVDNFAAQWLSLRDLDEALPQDAEFDANLREAMALETRLFFTDLIDEDLGVLHLLDADYTYLNERLARHYGIDAVRGSYMRRVELDPASPRRGLLGHGSWLTATSVADRTSPVIRGEWYITQLLGAPVPEPPPGVEADLSDEAQVAREGDTLRERLERHRANPTCAACHQIMDPIGLALENFDLVGRWRDDDNGRPVDTSVVMIDGTRIDSPADLRESLVANSELFVTALTEKLLTYALGRVVDYRDMPAVRRIVADAAEEDYRFSSLVFGIASSVPFQQRVKTGDEGTRMADEE